MFITASVLIIAFFSVTIYLLSDNLRDAEENSRVRMTAIAAYIAGTPLVLNAGTPDSVDVWLGDLMKAVNLEYAVIADSNGMVTQTSQPIIERGDPVGPVLIDTAAYSNTRESGVPHFSPIVKIENVYFQSLYYPFTYNNSRCMIILESDQQYYAELERYRAGLVAAVVLMSVLFICLLTGLAIFSRKIQNLVSRLRRNDRLAFLGTTSAELAHDLKNPLGIIKTSVDVLRKKFDAAQEEPAFTFVSEEVMRLSRLIDGILSFSRDRELRHEPINPGQAIERVVRSLQIPENIQITTELPPDIEITGDPDAFHRIGDNLIRNSVQAMKDNGAISILFRQCGNDAHIIFTDNGPGIPVGLKNKLFEPFVSGTKTGSGLGLAIVKTLCERSGWAIEATTREGKTCFDIAIPGKLWRKSS